MATAQQLQTIAAQLRDLQRTSPINAQGVPAWDASARAFAQQLHSQHPELSLPVQVIHYLHDADIRVKDPKYRASQDDVLNGIIGEPEHGNVPESTGTTVSFHPRWLGAAALVFLAVVCWVALR